MRDGLANLIFVTLLGASACATDPTSAETGDATTSAGSSDTTTDEPSTTSTSSNGSGDMSNDDSDTSLSFYASAPVDDLMGANECDPFVQDCIEGKKCVPFASTGRELDANRCVPILGDVPVGGECVYQGPVVAMDDCDATSHCFDITTVDGQHVGTCHAFCDGTADDPQCATGTACLISNEGSVALCVEICDPLVQDCEPGEACHWGGDGFVCLPEAEDPVANGEPCDGYAVCETGTVCIFSNAATDCAETRCCSEVCDASDMNYVCANPNYTCQPWFEMAPMGLENVGVCLAPA